MAKKPTISTVASGFLSRDQINTNFTNIYDSFDNTFSLDGSTPNTLAANIDLNGYDLLNIGSISVLGYGVVDFTEFNTVSSVVGEITTLAPIAADITSVVGISADITAVAGISSDVTAVASISADVTTVSGISADVTAAAANSADISNFSNVYRISATEPATSLDNGDLYWNTTSNDLWVYNGSEWDNAIGMNTYDIRFGFSAQPTSSQVIETIPVVRTITFPADFVGSLGAIGVNPTASFTLSLEDDGVQFGTVTVSTGGVFTYATTGGVEAVIEAGSMMTIVAPETTDATAQNLVVTLLGNL